MDSSRMDRSLGELFADLSQQTAELVRHEMQLAQAELRTTLADVGRHALLIAAGAVCALAAVMAVAAGVTLLLIELGVVPWVAAVITAVLMGGAGFALAQAGVSALKTTSIAPVETIRSLKETTQWLRNPSAR